MGFMENSYLFIPRIPFKSVIIHVNELKLW